MVTTTYVSTGYSIVRGSIEHNRQVATKTAKLMQAHANRTILQSISIFAYGNRQYTINDAAIPYHKKSSFTIQSESSFCHHCFFVEFVVFRKLWVFRKTCPKLFRQADKYSVFCWH